MHLQNSRSCFRKKAMEYRQLQIMRPITIFTLHTFNLSLPRRLPYGLPLPPFFKWQIFAVCWNVKILSPKHTTSVSLNFYLLVFVARKMKKLQKLHLQESKNALTSWPIRTHVSPNSIYNKLSTLPSRKKGVIFQRNYTWHFDKNVRTRDEGVDTPSERSSGRGQLCYELDGNDNTKTLRGAESLLWGIIIQNWALLSRLHVPLMGARFTEHKQGPFFWKLKFPGWHTGTCTYFTISFIYQITLHFKKFFVF